MPGQQQQQLSIDPQQLIQGMVISPFQALILRAMFEQCFPEEADRAKRTEAIKGVITLGLDNTFKQMRADSNLSHMVIDGSLSKMEEMAKHACASICDDFTKLPDLNEAAQAATEETEAETESKSGPKLVLEE